jgi:CheY-like chemotaxis protein
MKLILVIDDDAQVRAVTKTILENAGYAVQTVADGNEASRFLGEIVPHLIITDILLPKKDGLELIQEARRDHPGIRIIAITGGSKVEPDTYLRIAKSFGADQLLAKPFSSQELLRMVEQVLQ